MRDALEDPQQTLEAFLPKAVARAADQPDRAAPGPAPGGIAGGSPSPDMTGMTSHVVTYGVNRKVPVGITAGAQTGSRRAAA